MEPTIRKDERILADMQAYRNSPPKRGDVVIYRTAEDLLLPKRVIAVEGDTIMEKDRQVFVNGSLLIEPYIQHVRAGPAEADMAFMDNFGPVRLPAGKLFVMGDNRDVSYDSRHPEVGPIAVSAVRGKVLQILKSPYPGRSGTEVR
jgi:signal peptidase I